MQKAIDLGIRKFNINTEVSNTGVKTIREYLLKYPENKKLNLRLETVLEEARKQMTEKIINYIKERFVKSGTVGIYDIYEKEQVVEYEPEE